MTHISWSSQKKIILTWSHPNAVSLYQCVAEIILWHINSFSILERQGFCNEMKCREQRYHILSLKYISLVVCPQKYEIEMENRTGNTVDRRLVSVHYLKCVTCLNKQLVFWLIGIKIRSLEVLNLRWCKSESIRDSYQLYCSNLLTR